MKILLVTFPRRAPHIFYATAVPEALGILSACVKEAGMTVDCRDYDNHYFRQALFHRAIMEELDEYFRDVNPRQYHQAHVTLSPAAREWYFTYLDQAIDEILDINPEYLGVSFFSEQSIRATVDFLERLSKRNHEMKIVAGGYCMGNPFNHHGDHPLASGPYTTVGDWLLRHYIDYYVLGEGEKALVELLQGNDTYPGINGSAPQQIDDLDSLPVSDYHWANFRNYLFPNPTNPKNLLFPMLSVTGTRGCVRKCLFCDIASKWPKFRYRDANKLADEIIHYREEYGVRSFHWSDSLVNASPPMMNTVMERLAEYGGFHQTGSFIIREKHQMPERYFQTLKKAGFSSINFGLESGSPRVRDTMNKSFSQEAVLYTVEMCRKYDIQCQMLTIIGYPTEEEEDHQMTLDLIRATAPRWKGDESVIYCLSSFGFFYDAHESPLNRDPAMYGITHDPVRGWKSPSCDNYLAMTRTREVYELLESLSYPVYEEFYRENNQDIAFVEEQLRACGREGEIIK